MGKVYLTLDKLLSDPQRQPLRVVKRTGIRYPIIDNYYKNKVVRYDSYVLERICSALDCSLSDLIRYENKKRGDTHWVSPLSYL